jgi:hypothetical protein
LDIPQELTEIFYLKHILKTLDMVNAYRKLATEHGWVVLDSNKEPKDIHQEVIVHLRNNFK